MSNPSVQVRPATEADLPSLHRTLDDVARESHHLGFLQAPPLQASQKFWGKLLAQGLPPWVAVPATATSSPAEILGWCDIAPLVGEARSHVGVLGVGLVARARGQGLGRRLMHATITQAWAHGLTRIELTVRADNTRARLLYEHLGFEHEGTLRRASRVDGVYYDTLAMALLR